MKDMHFTSEQHRENKHFSSFAQVACALQSWTPRARAEGEGLDMTYPLVIQHRHGQSPNGKIHYKWSFQWLCLITRG